MLVLWSSGRNQPSLQALVWSAMLLTSHGLRTTTVVGAPVKRDGLPTRTVTVDVAYKSTLAPGYDNYNLLGCYNNTGLDGRGGHPFGKQEDYASPSTLDGSKLTISACLNGCYSLKPTQKDNGYFAFAGLRNGR